MATSRLFGYHSLLGIVPRWSFLLGALLGRSLDRMFSIPFGFRAEPTMRKVGKTGSRLSQDSSPFFTDFGLKKIRPGSHGLSVRDSRLKPFLLKSSISFTTELIFRFWRQSVLQPESSSRFRMSSLLY